MLFERRTEQPSKDNKYYLHTPKGYNKCIKITGDECIPNCVGYAYGRWMEAQKIKKCNLPTSNAENWYHDYTGKKGKIVKLGSVIVWKKGKIHFSKDGSGHVAYVECVYPDGSIDTSESAYGGKRWYTKHYNKKYTKTGYQFEGFIYPDVEFEDHPFTAGWYKTLNNKYVRRTPEVATGNKIKYKELPKFPEVRRDLALLLDESVNYADLRKSALRVGKKLLKQVSLFDVYRGDKIAEGKKQYALSFVLQDLEKTLTDNDVEKVVSKLLSTFQNEFGAVLR